jgi:hypothetical protein
MKSGSGRDRHGLDGGCKEQAGAGVCWCRSAMKDLKTSMEDGWEALVKDQMRLNGAGLGRGSWAVSGRSARLGVGICGVAEGGIALLHDEEE